MNSYVLIMWYLVYHVKTKKEQIKIVKFHTIGHIITKKKKTLWGEENSLEQQITYLN